MLWEIKFDSMTTVKFMDWLKKEKIYIDMDLLGMKKTVTIGYLLKLHMQLTNHTTLKSLLINELCNVVVDPQLAINLDPALKEQQLSTMSNGDIFVLDPPPFEIYQTEIMYGHDKERVRMDVLGIKCLVNKARLLKEFFSQMANQWSSRNKWDCSSPPVLSIFLVQKTCESPLRQQLLLAECCHSAP